MSDPTTICNQALDDAGIAFTLDNIEEGTREAQVCLRQYGETVRQLLRTANWDFARKTAPMVLLADATGQTPNVGIMVPTPWTYVYQLPIDCQRARYVPLYPIKNQGTPAGNITTPVTVPLTTGTGNQNNWGRRNVPARFLISNDFNYPVDPSQLAAGVQGVGETSRTVILTNVRYAQLVYTATLMDVPLWDSLFRECVVAFLAYKIALALHKDVRTGLAVRSALAPALKEKISQARIADGNEGTYSTGHLPDFMAIRNSGGGAGWNNGWGAGGGDGMLYNNNFESIYFGDAGSAY